MFSVYADATSGCRKVQGGRTILASDWTGDIGRVMTRVRETFAVSTLGVIGTAFGPGSDSFALYGRAAARTRASRSLRIATMRSRWG
jgi:hypothetical protein